MNTSAAIARVVLTTPPIDKLVEVGESRPVPMFHLSTLIEYGEMCASEAYEIGRESGINFIATGE